MAGSGKKRGMIRVRDPEKSVQDCNGCDFWRGLNNRAYQGVRIPKGSGKCCRPEGHCYPERVRN